MKKNKALRSLKIWFIFFCILLLVCLAVWGYTWLKAAELQENRPEELIEDLAKDFANGRSYSYARNKRLSGIVYTVSIDDVETADFYFKAKEEKGIVGLDLYELGEIKGKLSKTAVASPDAQLKFNGELAKPVTQYAIFDLAGLEGFMDLPVYNIYEINEQTVEPGISFAPGFVNTKINSLTEAAIFCALDLGADEASLQSFAKEYAEVLAYYMIGQRGWDDIKPFIAEKSPIRSNLSNFVNSWYRNYIGAEFSNISLTELVKYSPNLVAGDLKFSMSVEGKYKTTDYDVAYRCIFVKNSDNSWQICDMFIN